MTDAASPPPKPEHYCAHCANHIPRNSCYFQGVPAIGDLCIPCHVKWCGVAE